MSLISNDLCYGCLSTGRKMQKIDELSKRQCLLQIISEIPLLNCQNVVLSLCWECDAHLNRFLRLKEQFKQSYTVLNDCIKQNPTLHSKSKSFLRTHKVINITLDPNSVGTEYLEVVKLETDLKEGDNDGIYLDDHSDEDFTPLIQLETINKCNGKLKSKKVRKKKRLKKEFKVYDEVELSPHEVEEERKEMEAAEDYINAMFRCEKCIVSFPNNDDLLDHIRYKHELNSSNYKCKICECSFKSEVTYNYHTNKHKKRYQCVICTERLKTKCSILKHYNVKHCGRSDINPKKIKKKDDQLSDGADDIENKSVHQPTLFSCQYCPKSFSWKTSLRKHMESHRIETGQKRKPYCEPCRLSFSSTSNLQKHVKTSSKHQIQLKLRQLKESLPDDSTGEKQAKIDEIKNKVNSSKQHHPCPLCDKKFQWRGNAQRHLLTHSARINGDLVCVPCDRKFSSIATYNQHMKISKKHVTENDFKFMCSDCGKRFPNKTILKDHINWEHLKNYVHKCPICIKVFKSQTSLYLHKQVVHNKQNAEHLCDHCGKSYPNHAKLRSHITALHTAESPYKCSWCSAKFGWHSCLSRHVRQVHRDRADKQTDT